jgi:arginase family enzyme
VPARRERNSIEDVLTSGTHAASSTARRSAAAQTRSARAILSAAIATGLVAGVDVTIYNPALDPAGTA